jgi:hypothetical protein
VPFALLSCVGGGPLTQPCGPHWHVQLCEAGYSMNFGVCSPCHSASYGRVTTFGIIVFSVAPVLAAVGAFLYFCKVRCCLRYMPQYAAALVCATPPP